MKTSAELRSLYPDKYYAPADLIPDALLFRPELATFGADVQGDAPLLRVPYTADDTTTTFVDEGAEIPLSDPTVNEIWIATRKLAVLSENSRESLANTPGSSDILIASQVRSLINQSNHVFLNNTPGNGQSTGILVDALPITDTVQKNLDPIADAVTAVQVNHGNPTAVVIDPVGLGVLRKMKAGDTSAQTLLQIDANSGALTFYGVPVIVAPQMPARTGLVVDGADIISAHDNIEADFSEDSAFSRDSRQFRMTLRVGWKKIHPSRHWKFQFAAPTA